MKKRIIAGAILALMLLSSLCLPALAAGAFPYEEYEKEGYLYVVRHNHDYDTERGEVIFPSGLMLVEHVNYKGYREGAGRNHPLYDQTANLTVSLPDKITDDLGTTVSYQTYSFTTFGGDNFKEIFEYEGAGPHDGRYNSITYSVSHSFSALMLSPDDDNDTVDEAIAKKADYWSRYFKTDDQFGTEYNQAKEPVAVEKHGNCTVVIGRDEIESYEDTDNSINKLYVYGFNSRSEYKYSYRIYCAVPGLEGVFLEITYSERGFLGYHVEDKARGDYRKYIDDYEKIVGDHRDLNFAGQLIDLGSLITVTWDDPVVGEAQTAETGQNAGVTQTAEETPGEDRGVSVPAVIVLGVAAAGAAVAGAAAASGKGGDGDDREKKEEQKSYVMFVQKDFGDAIRRGAKPVTVRARMAEIGADGRERDRADLTAKITANCEDAQLCGTRVSGRYYEADVAVPEDEKANQATVAFIFNGPDATFTNRVVFRVVDGPLLEFGEETFEGSGAFRFYSENYGIDAIPGDGFTYPAFFRIVDAVKPPELADITSEKVDGYDVEFEETKWQSVYRVIVKNRTPAEKNDDVFAKVKENRIEIRVNVEGEKEPVRGWLTMYMYPEGLTVQSKEEGSKNGVRYVRVQAYEKENAGDLDKKWQVSEMTFTLAVKGEDKAIIDPKGMEFSFDRIKGGGGKGTRADKEQSIADKYEYEESHRMRDEKFAYSIEPKKQLWEPDDGTFFIIALPVKCTLDGDVWSIDVPLRLRGKDPDPMEEWNREYEKTRERVEKFSLPGNKQKWLEKLESCSFDPKVSVQELRLVSKWILREYMDYWTDQNKKDLSEATMYNVIVNVLEWTKFAGDCAFSFLVSAYAGPVADALLSPAKDFITGAIGEVIAARSYGEEIDVDKFEFSKNLAAAGDNLVSSGIDLKDWRKAAATLAGYFCYAAIKNYFLKLNEKGESDFFGALCEGFKDMTAAALKSKAGDLIGKWLKESKRFQEKIGPKIASWFKETNFDTLQKKLNDSLGLEGELRKLAGFKNDSVFEAKVRDVVESYIGSLVGAGFDKVREVYDSSKFALEGTHVTYCFNIDLFDAFHYGIKLDLTKIMMDLNGPFFGWFYDYFFANIPTASSVISLPKDPPLPPRP